VANVPHAVRPSAASGSAQGRPNDANPGDRQGAIDSFRKAKALIAPLAKSPDTFPADIAAYLDTTSFMAATLGDRAGGHEEALAAARSAANVTEQYARAAWRVDDAAGTHDAQ